MEVEGGRVELRMDAESGSNGSNDGRGSSSCHIGKVTNSGGGGNDSGSRAATVAMVDAMKMAVKVLWI